MASKTLLGLVQEFSKRRGLPPPATVTGAQNDTTRQMWGLLNEGIADIADRFLWQHLRTRKTFTHAASTDYTALDLSENGPVPGYKGMVPRTLWDIDSQIQVAGPLDPQEWSSMLASAVAPAVYSYTVYGNALRIYPAPNPVIPNQFSMEYLSNYGVWNPSSSALVLDFETDACWPLFPSSILLQDLKWRWNQAKGLAYAEDMRQCEEMLLNLQSRDPAPEINMGESGFEQMAGPGLYVAAGGWPL